MNNMLKGVIFDMDGVIVQTSRLHELAWRQVGHAYAFEWPKGLDFQRQVFGTVSADSARLIFGTRVDSGNFAQIVAAKDRFYRTLLQAHVTCVAVPGVVRFIREVAQADLSIALATSSAKLEADLVLTHLGISRYFEAVVDVSCVKHPKPHPEIYWMALRSLNLHPAECVAFEDSLWGIEAVRRAGIRCVVVKTSLDRQRVKASNLVCELAIDHFNEMTVERLHGITSVAGEERKVPPLVAAGAGKMA
jgi:beta-phosphoglucomutase